RDRDRVDEPQVHDVDPQLGVDDLGQGLQDVGGGGRRVDVDELHFSGHLVVTTSRGRVSRPPSVRATTVPVCHSWATAPTSSADAVRAASVVLAAATA